MIITDHLGNKTSKSQQIKKTENISYTLKSNLISFRSYSVYTAKFYSTFLPIVPLISYNNLNLNKKNIILELKNKSGIYRFVNKINGNCYVGSSINLGSRFKYHIDHYYNHKENSIIYNAFKKYDLKNFSFEILEYCDKDSLIQREQYYIDTLEPLYNILKFAGSPIGRKLSEEAKIKIRKSNGYQVEIMNVNTNEKFLFDSIRQAENYLKAGNNTLSYCIKNNKLYKKLWKIIKK